MKIYVSADMEGLSGVVSGKQVSPGNSDYEKARKRMAREINVVIDALFAGGADEVLVNDSHGTMDNLLVDDLDDRARLISGSPKPMSMMQGINEKYDAVFFVGYHGKPGMSQAMLDHIYSSSTIFAARINGQSISEAGINGRLAGYFGVPAVFISGDQCAVECAKEELNNPVGVVVKHTIGRTCAELYPFKKVKYKINDGVARAMEKISSYKPVLEEGSKELEIDFVKTSMAEMASLIPGVKRINGRTIVYSTEDFLELYKVFMAAIVMASKSN